MTHINLKRIPLPEIQPLIDAADAAQREINAEPDPQRRNELIKSHRPKWVAFRSQFDKLSHGKCWYTESRNPGTDDDVDHFRPKNRLAEDETHGGYYWQSLTWTNFRLSCHHSNRLRHNPNTNVTHGKADHFPLLDPETRARKPADDLAMERPALLDPTDPFDPPKLTFSPDGTVAIAPRFENDADVTTQVEMSRVYLHLDWPEFIDDRTQLYNQIAFKIEEGKQHATRTEEGDVGSRVAFKSIVTDLADMTKDDQPYSAAASAYIAIYRDIWWVRDVVLKIPPMQGAA